jgi:hypothetical protein
MSLTMAILMLVGMWLSVAAAMLWGVLRIVRRHCTTTCHRRHRQAAAGGHGGMPGCTKLSESERGAKRPVFLSTFSRLTLQRARRARMLRISIAVENAMAAYT